MAAPSLIVVDDEPDMAALIGHVAEELGFSVRVAQNGEQFQRLWDEEKPAAAVLDIVMPDMDGNELLDWLIQQGGAIPVVLVSGFGGRYLELAHRLGSERGATITANLTKPIRIGDLRDALRGVLSHLGHTEPGESAQGTSA